ncbi:MAG: TadE/TadG family type IV pilus assembly protein [Planctomycetota bacterium]
MSALPQFWRGRSSIERRRGGVLVEFALVSLALYLVLAAILGVGRWLAVAQAAQDAARFAAREIALFPLPADSTFAEALADPGFQGAVYDPDLLVVDLVATPPGPALEAFFAAMPVVNRALRPLMVTSNVDTSDGRRRVLHVPGAIVDSPTSPTGLSVVVPRILERDPESGAETQIQLAPFLEEVSPGSFSALGPDRGLVAIRLNVAYQSATLAAYIPTGDFTPSGDPFQRPIEAGDVGGSNVIVGPGPEGAGPYSGGLGLGRLETLGVSARPFRRLIAAQALFRREVFL